MRSPDLTVKHLRGSNNDLRARLYIYWYRIIKYSKYCHKHVVITYHCSKVWRAVQERSCILINFKKCVIIAILHVTYRADMRYLWEISVRSPLRDIPLRNISKEMNFFVTSLWRLTNMSKRMYFCDVFKTSRAYLKRDVYSATSLRRLRFISCKYLWFFQIYPLKIILCDYPIIYSRTVRNTHEIKGFLGVVHRYQSSLSWVSVGWYLRESFGK